MKSIFLFLLLLTAEQSATWAQLFPNLDFELVKTANVTYSGMLGTGSVADLLPGWEVMLNNVPLQSVQFDPHPLNLQFGNYPPPSFTVLENPQNPYPFIFPNVGKYWIQVYGTPSDTYSLITHGEVPSWATRLLSNGLGAAGAVTFFRMNGETLVWPGDIPGLDVSKFAGQNVELRIDTTTRESFAGPVIIDSMNFIPEPSSIRITGAAAAVVVTLRWLRRWLRGLNGSILENLP